MSSSRRRAISISVVPARRSSSSRPSARVLIAHASVESRDLRRVLDLPQGARGDLDRQQFNARDVIAGPSPGRDGQRCGIKSHVADPAVANGHEQVDDQIAGDDQFHVRRFVTGLDDVAAIGGQQRLVRRDDHRGVGPGEATEIADVGQVGDQQSGAVLGCHALAQPVAARCLGSHSQPSARTASTASR
ncbi:MAG: hypothetical protein V9E82_10250 [Candidatus Nanopelagicales bacterium]